MILDIFSNPSWILQTEGENLNRKAERSRLSPFSARLIVVSA